MSEIKASTWPLMKRLQEIICGHKNITFQKTLSKEIVQNYLLRHSCDYERELCPTEQCT